MHDDREISRLGEIHGTPGRPKFYVHPDLAEVWLFIEEQKRRTGLSVNKICKTQQFTWNTIGRGGVAVVNKISGGTLRRRYYEACELLNKEDEAYHKLRNLRSAEERALLEPDEMGWTMRYYHSVLEQRLAG